MDAHSYRVDVSWRKDRKGVMCSPELTENSGPCIEVATPPDFPRGMPGIWSPEHLFTAAVSSCLMTTFLAIAENSKLEFSHFSCGATGVLEQVDGKLMMTRVLLKPVVTISRPEDRERAERVLQKSEAACLISRSIRAEVIMEPQILIES